MRWTGMTRLAGALLTGVLVLGNAHANAQAGATPPTARNEIAQPAAQPPTADDVCRTLEQAAAENALPVEFFARVIWQESRFNARAVSSKGAKGIAQFMPHTANWHGLGDPFNPIEALRHSAAYLRELRERFGNLGLAAAAYNAGPGRISAWLINHRNHRNHRPLPGETRDYVAIVTGRTADEWASPSSPQRADTTIPQGVPCTRLANLVLAPRAASPSLPQTETIIPEGVANLLLAPRQGVANLLLAPRAASPSLPQNTTIPEGVALLLAPRAASPSLPQNTTIPEGVVLLLAPRGASPSLPQTDTTIPEGVANLLLAPTAASPSLRQTDTTIPQGVANLLAPRAASPSLPQTANTTIPQGVADLVLAPRAASPSSPQRADTTIPQGVPCTRLANLVLAPRAASPSSPQRGDTTIPQGVPRTRLANLVLAPKAASPSPPQMDTTNPQGVADLVLAPRAASPSPPPTDTTIPQGVANLVPAPSAEDKHVASYVPRWGVWLAADLSESKAWALYRERLRRFVSLIGDREPVVLFRQLPGMGRAKRYIIAIADDDRAPLDKFCEKLTAAGSTCDVMRNEFGP
jgi:Transglycosylase SLT domain